MPTSSIQFEHKWREFARPDGLIIYRPVLPVMVRGQDDLLTRFFLVDSGADLSMAPRELCQQLGLRWQDGARTTLRGISSHQSSVVQGRIHEVDILIPDASMLIRLPMVFARASAPFVLGREGFFAVFNITFEKVNRRTVFQLVEN